MHCDAIRPCVNSLVDHVSRLKLPIHVSSFNSAMWIDGFLPCLGFVLAHMSCHGSSTYHALVGPWVKFLFNHVAYAMKLPNLVALDETRSREIQFHSHLASRHARSCIENTNIWFPSHLHSKHASEHWQQTSSLVSWKRMLALICCTSIMTFPWW